MGIIIFCWGRERTTGRFGWLHDTTDECWYYHFLKPWVHYIPFNLENLEETWNKVKDDNGLILKIVANANEFVQDYLSERGHGLYCLSLLEGIGGG